MRSPATLLRSAVATAAAVVLLTACGGSGDDEPAASSSSASPSSTSASAEPGPSGTATPDPAAAEFCDQVEAAFSDLQATLGTAGPAEVAGRLPEVVSRLEAVEAPADIAPSWNAMLDGLRQLGATASTLDLSTPEGQAQFNAAEQQLTQELSAAQADLTTYVTQNCDVASSSPAPSS
ncbi:hypothetical protein ACI789_10300 [Geodermatophilus sp. SYSU D00965]